MLQLHSAYLEIVFEEVVTHGSCINDVCDSQIVQYDAIFGRIPRTEKHEVVQHLRSV